MNDNALGEVIEGSTRQFETGMHEETDSVRAFSHVDVSRCWKLWFVEVLLDIHRTGF
jgi:hypothetical protein